MVYFKQSVWSNLYLRKYSKGNNIYFPVDAGAIEHLLWLKKNNICVIWEVLCLLFSLNLSLQQTAVTQTCAFGSAANCVIESVDQTLQELGHLLIK